MFEREIHTLSLVSSQIYQHWDIRITMCIPNSYEIDIKMKNSKVFKSYIE